MIVLYHRSGTKERPPCGGPALGLIEEPMHKCFGVQVDRASEDGPPSALVLKLDGTKPQRGEPMVCGSCKEVIYPYEVDK
jgi:hypothetical protein